MILSPSILAADFARLGEATALMEAAGADWLHVDVMDGRFVPNISVGLPVVRSLAAATNLPLDVHLMVVEPERQVESFIEAGADRVTVHVEATCHLNYLLSAIRKLEAKAAVALNPATPASFLPLVKGLLDHVLVMSVNPGWGGQPFLPQSIERIRSIRKILDGAGMQDVPIAVDGGINDKNAKAVRDAGAEILIAGSAIFKANDPAAAVASLRR